MIKVVCYGSGNVKAIFNIYKRLGIECELANTQEDLKSATKIVLPGVGAFDEAIVQLERAGMKDILNTLVLEKNVPVLGICVGMQVMAEESEEGQRKGLGWIGGKVKKMDTANLRRKPYLPHMGWNNIIPQKTNEIFNNVDIDRGFYFLHSYYFSCDDMSSIIATSNYGSEFPCAIQSKNIYAVQFHPEKSHENGVTLLKNFANL